MAGWEIKARLTGGFMVTRFNPESGDDEVAVLDPNATVDELWSYVLRNGEVGDWCIGPDDHGVMLVGVAEDGDTRK